MKAAEAHKLTDRELEEKMEEYKVELFNLRWQSASHQNQNPKRSREVKKNIARILTIVSERKRKDAEQ